MPASPEDPENSGHAQQPPTRHICHFEGCGRSFIRKEHLTRHKKSHSAQRSFVCHICQNAFTRNDILQRHINRHKGSSNSAEANGQACNGCQSSKTRCEDGFPCRSCLEGGIECISKHNGRPANQSIVQSEPQAPCKSSKTTGVVESDSTASGVNAAGDESLLERVSPAPVPPSKRQRLNGHTENNLINTARLHALDAQDSIFIPRNDLDYFDLPTDRPMSQPVNVPSTGVSIDQSQAASSMQVDIDAFNFSFSPFDDQPPAVGVEDWAFPADLNPRPWYPTNAPDPVTRQYYELYLAHFHHRWPILHIPTIAKGSNPYLISASIEMVGAWQAGTSESRTFGLLPTLPNTKAPVDRLKYQKPLYMERYKSWSLALHQAALLNIILGIYSGKENLISRVTLLLSILIAGLREMGFFHLEVAKLQDAESAYIPYLAIREEERKRLGAALLKVDCYLSIIRNQPMAMQVEELYFTLPSSFSYFNAPGVQVWEQRKLEEPLQRGQETVSSMVSDNAFSSITQPFMLPEDIQLGLCVIQSDVWQYVESVYNGRAQDMHNLLRQKSLRERLASWKRLLDETCFEESEAPFIKNVQRNYIPLSYYYGVEDHSKPGWFQVTANRPQSLLFDAMMLYHSLGLQMHSDTPRLYFLASLRRDSSTPHGWASRREQEDKAIHWSKVSCARQALRHALAIFEMHQSREEILKVQGDSLHQTLDPIAYVAIAKASLVVWGYAFFNDRGCNLCTSSGYMPDALELMEDLGNSTKMEDWIEAGGRAAVNGIVLCQCNVESLVQKFHGHLPTGVLAWDIAQAVSGGVGVASSGCTVNPAT